MTPWLTPQRWRVDCERQIGPWQTWQYEAHDSFVLALEAVWAHQAERPAWDHIAVVAVRGCGAGRRGLAAGGRRRVRETP